MDKFFKDGFYKYFVNFNYENKNFNQRYKNHISYEEIENEPIGMLMNPEYYKNLKQDKNEVAEPFINMLKMISLILNSYHFYINKDLNDYIIKQTTSCEDSFLHNFVKITDDQDKELTEDQIKDLCETIKNFNRDNYNNETDYLTMDFNKKVGEIELLGIRYKFLEEKFADTLPLVKVGMKIDGETANSIYYLRNWFLNLIKESYPENKIQELLNIKEKEFNWEKLVINTVDDKKSGIVTISDSLFEEKEFGNLMKRDIIGVYYFNENNERIYTNLLENPVKIDEETRKKMIEEKNLEIKASLEIDEEKQKEYKNMLNKIDYTIDNKSFVKDNNCHGIDDCGNLIEALTKEKNDSLEVLKKYNGDWYKKAIKDIKNAHPKLLKLILNKYGIKKVKIMSNQFPLGYNVPMKYEDWIKNLKENGNEKFAEKIQSPSYENVNNYFKGIIDFLRKEVALFNGLGEEYELKDNKFKQFYVPSDEKNKLKMTGEMLSSKKQMTTSDYASKFIDNLLSRQYGGSNLNLPVLNNYDEQFSGSFGENPTLQSDENIKNKEIIQEKMYNNIKNKLLKEGLNIDLNDENKIKNSIKELKILELDLKKSVDILNKVTKLSKMTGGLGENSNIDIKDINSLDSSNKYINNKVLLLREFIQNNMKLQEKINKELNHNVWPNILKKI